MHHHHPKRSRDLVDDGDDGDNDNDNDDEHPAPVAHNNLCPPFRFSPSPSFKRASSSKKQPLSCAECRRLKLKCDRVFPCQSCSKRGCAEICPDGALTSGKGSRFILANTEQLHTKIIQMSDRIRHLEDALHALYAHHSPRSPDPHPLLHPDLLRIKNSLELYSAHSVSVATPATLPPPAPTISRMSHPADQFSGPTSSHGSPPTAVYSETAPSPPKEHRLSSTASPTAGAALPSDIQSVSASFPLARPLGAAAYQRMNMLLPSRAEAERLCTQALSNVLWQYSLDPSATWLPSLVQHVYTSTARDLCPRRLALLSIVLAMGMRMDDDVDDKIQEEGTWNEKEDGEHLNTNGNCHREHRYHCPLGHSDRFRYSSPLSLANDRHRAARADACYHLARAALCETGVLDEPSVELVQILFYMIWYLLLFSDKSQDVSHAWSTMGLTIKLAQVLGLHRDCAHWKDIPEESQRRRMLLWELVNLDARLALSFGRPPSIVLSQVDCRRPSYAAMGAYGVMGNQSYHEWKHNFTIECLIPVLLLLVATPSSSHLQLSPPSQGHLLSSHLYQQQQSRHGPQEQYGAILRVDSVVRDFPVPRVLDLFGSHQDTSERSNLDADHLQPTMQQVLVASAHEIVLLQLHSNFFADALSEPHGFSYAHHHAPSVLATYLSAQRLVSTLDVLMQRQPRLGWRLVSIWFNAFSAAIALSLIASRTPFITLAPFALRELLLLHRLFAEAAQHCCAITKVLPILTRIVEKSLRTYIQWRTSTDASGSRSYSSSEDLDGMDVDNADSSSQRMRISSERTSSHHARATLPDGAFTDAHTQLRQCFQDIGKVAPPSVDEFRTKLARVSAMASAWSHNLQPALAEGSSLGTGSGSRGVELPTDFLGLASGKDDGSTLEDGDLESTAPIGTAAHRLGQTFNFDFGALTSTIDQRGNACMMWF